MAVRMDYDGYWEEARRRQPIILNSHGGQETDYVYSAMNDEWVHRDTFPPQKKTTLDSLREEINDWCGGVLD